jgi:hypothetical protein
VLCPDAPELARAVLAAASDEELVAKVRELGAGEILGELAELRRRALRDAATLEEVMLAVGAVLALSEGRSPPEAETGSER